MQKRLFITGGTGFFGKSMLDYRMRHPGWEWAQAEWVVLSRSSEMFISGYPVLANQQGVSFVEGDVRDFQFPHGGFDAIIHAATSAVTTLPDDEMTSVIIEGTRHIIEFARRSACKTILFTSSGAVYGPLISPAVEDHACNPATAYGSGKLVAEKMLRESGLDVKIARCFAFVGPYLNRKIHYAVGNFIQYCLDGRDIVIKGDGKPLRSYLYADDLVEWLFAVLERGEAGRPYNVGSDDAVSIKDLANAIRDVFGAPSRIKILGAEVPGAANVYVPDVGRAVEELGVGVKVGLRDAVLKSARVGA